jgi:hypothetical protein
MVSAGLFILSMLFIAGLAAVVAHGVGGRTAPGMHRGPMGAAGAIWPVSKQHANTSAVAPPVYRVQPGVPCWPGVWVGPAAALPPSPDYGGNHRQQLVQRRRPSSISARITTHGVLR